MFLKNIFNKKFIPVGIVFTAFIAIATIVRIGLMIYTAPKANMSFWQYPTALIIGFLYDIVVAFMVSTLLVVYVWFQNEFIYKKKIVPFVIGFFVTLISLLIFTNIFPKEFNEDVYKIFTGYIIFRFLLYLLMAFVPLVWRQRIR